ncbi:TIGR04013 family B12-binding domain/radical SAM domain-containing protein [Pseudothermotoga thermarum]|uniref:Radical SAM domain protein n=1 Tax=Pseudothermotoga thermarum DSM 5069 TaxID=688269 RepID=F7YVF2_9THEM|nr:TIGR04013 family B12-binding domain/radical SAM domain-containing protein [Pseudothermotoga thermarum]AEH50456.1 Radical SAM domain protein [Pseudothermotoga thermarum DSM 5069]
MNLIFRLTKTNRYSVIPLIAAIYNKVDVKIHLAKSLKEILSYPTDSIVAYSFMSFDVDWVKKEVETLKAKGYKVIAGGPHVTAAARDCIKLGFDAVFLGDGEKNLLDFLLGKDNKIFDGITDRVNLDDYPPFCADMNLFMPIEITRGCPFSCAYCATPLISGRKPRHRSVESIVYYSKLGVEKGKYIVRFISPNAFGYGSKDGITPNPPLVDELLFSLKKVGIREIYFGTFPSDVRPESVTDEMMKVIKKYVNNKSIKIGAQSGSDEILKKIKRGHDSKKVFEAVEIILQNGFQPSVDFIFGFPFETDEDRKQTLEMIKKLIKVGCKIHAHTFMPLPGTALAKSGPAVVPEWLKKELGRLSFKGLLDGFWQKQEDLSVKLWNIEQSQM